MKLNFFEKLGIVNNISKIINELYSLKENNAKDFEELKNLAIELIDKAKKIMPNIAKSFDNIINVFSKKSTED